MKFSVNKNLFQKTIAQAGRIAGKHLSLPALHCVLIVAEGREVILRATNLELGLEARIPATVEEIGTALVPATILDSFLSATPHTDSLVVSGDGKNVTITTPKTNIKIPVYNHEDFPVLPATPKDSLFAVKASEFAQALRSVSWAASPSSIKPELTSVFVHPNGKEIVCVATDSFRLAEKRTQANFDTSFEGVLIPLRNVGEIVRHIENEDGMLTVHGDGHQIGITVDGAYLSSRIIEGTFPDYQQIIPKEYVTTATLLKQDMLDALKQTRIFSDQFNKVTVGLNPDTHTVSLSTLNQATGESLVHLEGDVQGEALELNFNYTYWADPLQSIKTDRVVIECAGAGKPCRIHAVGDQSFIYIVMPMNR